MSQDEKLVQTIASMLRVLKKTKPEEFERLKQYVDSQVK